MFNSPSRKDIKILEVAVLRVCVCVEPKPPISKWQADEMVQAIRNNMDRTNTALSLDNLSI